MSVSTARYFRAYVACFAALYLGVCFLSFVVGSAYWSVFHGLSVFVNYRAWLHSGLVPVCVSAMACAAFCAPFWASAIVDRERKEGGRK